MTTILKIAKRYALPPRLGMTAALALPRYSRAVAIPGSEALWRWITAAALLVILAASISYVVAVNGILLMGEGMKQDRKTFSSLQQEEALLSSTLVARESPARLEANALAQGMVEATGVRFLNSSGAVALAR